MCSIFISFSMCMHMHMPISRHSNGWGTDLGWAICAVNHTTDLDDPASFTVPGPTYPWYSTLKLKVKVNEA